MSKRNFILLIIILTILAAVTLGYFYFYQPASTPTGTGEGTNFLSRFNPFAGGGTATKPTAVTPGADTTPTPEPEAEIPKVILKKISTMPVAGYGLFKKERFKDVPVLTPVITPPADPTVVTSAVTTTTTNPTGETQTKTTTTTKIIPKPTPPPTEFVTALRYVARSSGNIYQTFADKIDERKFSNTVIPKIYEAYFGNAGESVVMRYLKADDNTIETFVGNLPKEFLGADTTENNEVKGSFLAENIKDVSMSPDNSKLFYLFSVGDNIVGTTLSLLNNKKVQIFDSPFTEWLSWWPKSTLVTLTTKPSAFIPGYMYSVNPDTKKLNQVLSGINGLTTLASPDGNLVLYSSNDLSFNIYNVAARSSDRFGVTTLPDKCVWSKTSTAVYCAVPKFVSAAAYPDAWYKGDVSFSDEIWKIDITTGKTTMLLDPLSLAGVAEIDGTKLGLDEDEKYLFFVNKKDSYLWELQLQ